MGTHTLEPTPLTDTLWDDLEAQLSEGRVPPMHVLLATDGSEPARAAEDFVRLLPLPTLSRLEVMSVFDTPAYDVPDTLRLADLEWHDRLVQEAEARLRREGVRSGHHVARGAPGGEIVAAAEALWPDLIVVGSHGRTGLARLLLGSVAENVARHAGCPVLVARAAQNSLRRVVLAVDGSEHSRDAVRFAGRLPLPAETEVTVCHVIQPYLPVTGPEFVPYLEEPVAEVRGRQFQEAEKLVRGTAKQFQEWGKRVRTIVREGDPAHEILSVASEQKADLVIAGARGISALEALLVGSVADRLLRTARCSVLLAR